MPIRQRNKKIFGALLLLCISSVFALCVRRDTAAKKSTADKRAPVLLTDHVPPINTSSVVAVPTTTVQSPQGMPTTSSTTRPPATPTPKPSAAKPALSPLWRPNVGTTFDWLEDSSLANAPASHRDSYIVDAFDVTAATIASLHKQRARVICYINAGSWEDWRPDKNDFPDTILGDDYQGWEGERWLDIRSTALRPIMQKRFDLAKQKGCDGVDPDNIDGYANDTGFTITAAEQVRYNLWLSGEAHKRGLSIGLKNSADLLTTLLPSYDWAIIEECADQGWCAAFHPFIAAGKPVFQVEYTDSGVDFEKACAEAKVNRFTALLKHRSLDAWVQQCAD